VSMQKNWQKLHKTVLMAMQNNPPIARQGSLTLDPGAGPMPILRSCIQFDTSGALDSASGGYGKVVPAFKDVLSRVAVKIYNINQLNGVEQGGALKEATILSGLNHQNVVRCYGVILDPETKNLTGSLQEVNMDGSLVMEWGGRNLYKWLGEPGQQERVGLQVLVELAMQAAAGMDYLHGQNIVHGDVKPQNFLVREFNEGSKPCFEVGGPRMLTYCTSFNPA
jgi:serine/threonine protein kinase